MSPYFQLRDVKERQIRAQKDAEAAELGTGGPQWDRLKIGLLRPADTRSSSTRSSPLLAKGRAARGLRSGLRPGSRTGSRPGSRPVSLGRDYSPVTHIRLAFPGQKIGFYK